MIYETIFILHSSIVIPFPFQFQYSIFNHQSSIVLISGVDDFTESARSMLIPKRKEYLTTTQVAQYLGIDASTVRRHIKQGKLVPAKRVGNRAYFEQSQIEKELPF